jgi:hypothetical protein
VALGGSKCSPVKGEGGAARANEEERGIELMRESRDGVMKTARALGPFVQVRHETTPLMMLNLLHLLFLVLGTNNVACTAHSVSLHVHLLFY